MSALITDGDLLAEPLYPTYIGVTPISVSWQRGEVADPDDEETYFESYAAEVDGRDEPLTMIASDGIAHAVVFPELGNSYFHGEYDEYVDDLHVHDEIAEPIDEGAWNRLFDASPAYSGAEGPAINYLYPLDAVEQDPIEAAYRLRRLPLCVVERDGNWGLALTGGGQDLSWEIASAYMLLGYLPPADFADLPGMAGRGSSDADRQIIAACLRSFAVLAEQATRKAGFLAQSAAGWAARA